MIEYNETDEVSEPSSSGLIPIALAALGIFLGIAGLYFGFTAKKELNAMSASMLERTTQSEQAEEAITSTNFRITELEELLSEQESTIRRLRIYGSQSEEKIKKLDANLKTYGEHVVKVTEELNKVKASVTSGTTVRQTAQSQSINTADNSVPVANTASSKRTYKIASGDTFSSIASKFGVSVDSIIEANPYADPRRLRVDQEIIIPAK